RLDGVRWHQPEEVGTGPSLLDVLGSRSAARLDAGVVAASEAQGDEWCEATAERHEVLPERFLRELSKSRTSAFGEVRPAPPREKISAAAGPLLDMLRQLVGPRHLVR